MSHELRTPLTSIIGYLELMLEQDGHALDEDERQSFLRVMKRNSERLLAMVGDLLFVSKVNAGRFTISSEPVELATIAAGTVEAAEIACVRAQHRTLPRAALQSPDPG